ncbi:hypothetical protein NE462_18900, partial [Blautia hominis]|nr:hypothetical protein [Blautia hominis]
FRHLYSVYWFLLSCHNKRPSYDFYFIIEEPYKSYFTEKVSHSQNLTFRAEKNPASLAITSLRGFIPLLKLLGGWHYTLPMTPV